MKSAHGFTLVELLVSIAILGLILITIGAVLPGLAKVNRSSAQDQNTVLAARAYFEQVRAQLRSDFNSSVTGLSVPGNNQNGLACTPTETSKTSAASSTLKVSRTVTLTCVSGGRTSTFKLTVANPALGTL
ncbi:MULTISPECIES: type II secretion system protein J [Deinococcus]|jgi:prepilin-type N-terminal cleavage/methylation domain-containing protein|uniref:Prepilin-type N-terminal cleavage/methylation domain-containing protein n=2 Tax=Deinococcus soli (ex Cha et al. 2016) TaxID=1309411 RepID=A0ACC6KER2_9DEIO|nr:MULTISPECIES: type II secretion system protein [Deinococcus]MDK2011972.1 type II secretion system protein [Deinococcus sp. 43]MDR6217836.1 prepilin-type N-terminal cleavage/methylation domain-containing protein [Deinococcus soli (ex Cha et al. 2016)]MDR6328086.1 prepilin-type N-terminal cleavage/methylation domain-containing protein [Deinococcus soli (ex Cha et al. 2016)]MDR6750938.1 prepilin-type N-terminal cleavage/methylation domain-containing protein [Deinococcus soli (ex Cha et al. 2016